MNTTGFWGNIEYYRQIGNFIISETSYSPNEILKEHSHDQPILSIVLDGSLTEVYKNKAFNLTQMSIIYKPAYEVHSNKFHKQGAKCLNIQLTQKWVNHLRELGLTIDHILNTTNYKNNSILTRLKNELKTKDKYSEIIIEGLLIELFADIMRTNEYKEKIIDTTPHWLIKILNQIDLTKDEKLSINELAEEAGIHPVHLINTFKKYYHITPGEYLRQKKIDLVCKELCNSNKSLIDIALQFKFSDQSHFNKFFKKYVGVTPSQYIELHKVSKIDRFITPVLFYTSSLILYYTILFR